MTEWGMRFCSDFTFRRLREMQQLRYTHGNDATRKPIRPSSPPARKDAPYPPPPGRASSPRRSQPIGIVRAARVCDFNTQLASQDVPLGTAETLRHGDRQPLWTIASGPAMPKAETLPSDLRSPRRDGV
jgi:hypothetical protein